jgi:hypothetical protein
MMEKKQESTKKRNRRERLFVDPKVQGLLLMRVVTYWFVAVFAIALLIGYQVYLDGGSSPVFFKLKQVLSHFEPALIAALCILPVIMLDCLRVTSKFAGPLVRLRKEMRNLADGKDVEHLVFRKNDLYDELTDEFNRLTDQVEKLRHAGDRSTKQYANAEYEEPAGVI